MSELPPQTPTSPENPASTPDGAEAEPKRVFKLDPTEYSKMREALDNAPEAGTTAPESKASDEEISTEISDKDSKPLDSETKELPKYKERKRSANTRINLGEVATSSYLDKYLKPDEKTGLPVLRKRRKRRLGTKLGKEIERVRPAGAEVKSLLRGGRSLTTNRLSAEATAAVAKDYESRATGKRYGKIERLRGHLGATPPEASVNPKRDMALREIHQSLKNRTAAGIRESGIGAIVEDDSKSIEQWGQEVTNPENVKQLRDLMTASLKESGMDDDFTKVVIENAGINGSLNLDLVASYFGVDVEDWSRQSHGEKGIVPTVVVDHVNFLLKQDDKLLKEFAAHEPHAKSDRVEEWRQAAKADIERLARLKTDREELTPVIETLDELYMQLERVDAKSEKAKLLEAAIAREGKKLRDRGVSRFLTNVGDAYNANIHEPVFVEPVDKNEVEGKKPLPPVVIGVSGFGYQSNDGLIRRAKVAVKGNFENEASVAGVPGTEPAATPEPKIAGSPFISPAEMALAKRYVAGEFRNDKKGTSFPAMSPESIANALAEKSNLMQDLAAQNPGLSQKDIKKRAVDMAMPAAQQAHEQMQNEGIISTDYEANVGHRVLKTGDEILKSLPDDEAAREKQLIEQAENSYRIIDPLMYALKLIPEDQKNGKEANELRAELDKYFSALKSAGIDHVPANVGEPFDPKIHNAIESEGEGYKETVAEEYRAGFKVGDRLIRPADVKVHKES